MKKQAVNILVIDAPKAGAFLAKILSVKDWNVDTVEDASAALQRAREKRYDAVVLDYRKPDMDAAELCRRIKELQPDIREVFLTGQPSIGTVYPAMEAGAERVLAKPFDPDELVRTLEEQLAAAHSVRSD